MFIVTWIWYSSCLSWDSCVMNTCVLFNFYRDSSQNTRVTWDGLYASQLSCTACEILFVCCMRVTIRVLHDSKKHASNASCATCESVFLCVACKLTAIFCQRRIKAYNKKVPQQNMIKCVNTKKIFCQVFMYLYSNPFWITFLSNQMNAKHDNGTRFRQHRH